MPEGIDIVENEGTRRRGHSNKGRGNGNGKGRLPHAPTEPYRHTVSVLRANGTPDTVIARLLRLGVDALRKHYGNELQEGKETVTAALGSVVVNAGLNGNISAALSWLSRFGGEEWKKVEARLHGGLAGAPPIGVEARARVVIVLPDNGRPSVASGEVVE